MSFSRVVSTALQCTPACGCRAARPGVAQRDRATRAVFATRRKQATATCSHAAKQPWPPARDILQQVHIPSWRESERDCMLRRVCQHRARRAHGVPHRPVRRQVRAPHGAVDQDDVAVARGRHLALRHRPAIRSPVEAAVLVGQVLGISRQVWHPDGREELIALYHGNADQRAQHAMVLCMHGAPCA